MEPDDEGIVIGRFEGRWAGMQGWGGAGVEAGHSSIWPESRWLAQGECVSLWLDEN